MLKHISEYLPKLDKFKVQETDTRTLEEKIFDILEAKDQEIKEKDDEINRCYSIIQELENRLKKYG